MHDLLSTPSQSSNGEVYNWRFLASSYPAGSSASAIRAGVYVRVACDSRIADGYVETIINFEWVECFGCFQF